ncbi:uncharacterized protein LOC143002792 [Genypterus blacodes]|uniref:uncharacterized protein LOC143002792 n=1 Tax=Genypterus blacodes TaxID=154954 RepID=UPI003F758564
MADSANQMSANEGLIKPVRLRPQRRIATAAVWRGQSWKRLGPAEKRRGQKEKRRDQEERKEGVTVKRIWGGGKRRWDKKHYCVFCRRPQVKIARHLLRKHTDKPEVAKASALPTGSKQRHLLLEQLRCRGNYLHNIEVIRQGSGEIVTWRQPSEEVDARNYLPCPLCLGFFLRADLWKHQASCRRKLASDPTSEPLTDMTSDPTVDTVCEPTDDKSSDSTNSPVPDSDFLKDTPTTKQPLTSESGTEPPAASDPVSHQNVDSKREADQPRKRCRVQAAASRLLPISSGASESCSEVLHRMNQDYISHQVKSDWLICKYGNKLMGNQGGCQRRYDYVSQKLRELGRFLLAAKSLDLDVQNLQDLLAPARLGLALAAARKASGYRWRHPPLAVKATLKTVCEIAIEESLQEGDWEAAVKTTDFYHLLDQDWKTQCFPTPDTGSAATAVGARQKKRLVEPRGQKQRKLPDLEQLDPRPEDPSKSSSRPASCMATPESRLQPPVIVPVMTRKVRRRPWSSAEKEAVWRQLGVHVLFQSVPGKEVCQRCLDLEPVLKGRHWKDIKNQVHNQIQSQKKQMDLQEIQGHQDQSQKKQPGQQYNAQMEDQDHIQNQKKQQYHSQMDHQDQDHVHIQKKRHHQAQLDHQDQEHNLNYKKPHYQAQVDHRDEVHKKQVYPTDHHSKGLQTALDRDISRLTPYVPDELHGAPAQTLLDQDPTIYPYPAPHWALGLHMHQLLSRQTAWTEESMSQNYTVSRQPPGGPTSDPHPGHVLF